MRRRREQAKKNTETSLTPHPLLRFAVLEATKVAEMSTASAMQIDAPPPAPVRLPSPEKRVAPPVFKNDPLGVSEADQYDVKHGIKSRSEIDFEKQQRVIAERAMEVSATERNEQATSEQTAPLSEHRSGWEARRWTALFTHVWTFVHTSAYR